MTTRKPYHRAADLYRNADRAAVVDSVLKRRPATAAELCALFGITRRQLDRVIKHLRWQMRREVLTIGKGDALEYELPNPPLPFE